MTYSMVFKLPLDPYDAETDTDPDHFSLYVDQVTDYILIKEKERNIVSVPTGGAGTAIGHSLGYVPFCLVFAETSSGVWRKLFSRALDTTGLWFTIDGTNLTLINTTGSTKRFSYYLFYDNIT